MGLLASPAPVASSPSGGTGLLSKTSNSPVSTTTPTSSAAEYFYTKNPDTSTIGAADETDPYSGTPYFAYRTPGVNATTTDYTRVATKFNPEIAAKTPATSIQNKRMPESASKPIRSAWGATSSDELDHIQPLELAGSNNEANLRVEKNMPSSKNTPTDALENTLAQDVQSGKESLFQAQAEMAKAKGVPAPFTDSPTHHQNLLDYIEAAFKKLPSELAGIHNPF